MIQTSGRLRQKRRRCTSHELLVVCLNSVTINRNIQILWIRAQEARAETLNRKEAKGKKSWHNGSGERVGVTQESSQSKASPATEWQPLDSLLFFFDVLFNWHPNNLQLGKRAPSGGSYLCVSRLRSQCTRSDPFRCNQDKSLPFKHHLRGLCQLC